MLNKIKKYFTLNTKNFTQSTKKLYAKFHTFWTSIVLLSHIHTHTHTHTHTQRTIQLTCMKSQ